MHDAWGSNAGTTFGLAAQLFAGDCVREDSAERGPEASVSFQHTPSAGKAPSKTDKV
jgi:hypothetical protein